MTIKELLESNERVVNFSHTGDYYNTYSFIAPNDININRLDISGCIEYTLHQILGAGGTEKDVREILGAEQIEQSELEEMNEEYVSVDLGYYIPGLIMHIEEPKENLS